MTDFASWLESQIQERGWSKSEFSQIAGIDTGTISNLTNDIRKPGPEVCRKIAGALKLSQCEVFFRAGLVTEDPGLPRYDPISLDILTMLQHRPQEDVEAALAAVKALFSRFDRGKDGSTTGRDGTSTARQKR